jgi:hypothetical protein
MNPALKFTGIKNHYQIGKYGVEENSKKLLRYVYFHQQLMFVGCAQLPIREDWELKQGIGRHIYEDAEASTALRKRVTELRTSPARLGKAPDPFMELFFEELTHIKNDYEFVALIYGYIKPQLLAAYKEHVKHTQQIVDQPTIRMFREIILDLEEQVAWGTEMMAHLREKERSGMVTTSPGPETEEFIAYLRKIEKLGGGFDAEGKKSLEYPDKLRSRVPFSMTQNVVRDSKVMGPTVNYRTSMGERIQDAEKQYLIDMMRVRQEEMVAAELLASIIFMQKDMDWEFYRDLARHLWDEIRHCMFGQAALEIEGYEWRKQPQFAGDYDLIFPKMVSMRYAWLAIGIEDKQMKRPGKAGEYEFCRDVVKHELMTQFQDYDWTDEVTHAAFGRKWTPEMFDEDLETIREFTLAPVAEYVAKTGYVYIAETDYLDKDKGKK